MNSCTLIVFAMFLSLAQRVLFCSTLLLEVAILPYFCELQGHIFFEDLDGKHLSIQ